MGAGWAKSIRKTKRGLVRGDDPCAGCLGASSRPARTTPLAAPLTHRWRQCPSCESVGLSAHALWLARLWLWPLGRGCASAALASLAALAARAAIHAKDIAHVAHLSLPRAALARGPCPQPPAARLALARTERCSSSVRRRCVPLDDAGWGAPFFVLTDAAPTRAPLQRGPERLLCGAAVPLSSAHFCVVQGNFGVLA